MRYILAVFGVILLLILIVVLIVRGSSNVPQNGDVTTKKQITLTDYQVKPSTFILKTSGDITAEEERRAIRITVSASERVIEILEGYNETVTSRQTFTNNSNAYKTFLNALDKAGFSLERDTEIKDKNGICPFGRQFDYLLQDGSDKPIDTWNTSCAEKQGSFGGNGLTVRRLFEAQIPDYKTLVRDVKL